jgi:DNA-binding beta-propeller fold protein YncE
VEVGLSNPFAEASEDPSEKTATSAYTPDYRGQTYWQQVIVYKTDLGEVMFATDNIQAVEGTNPNVKPKDSYLQPADQF